MQERQIVTLLFDAAEQGDLQKLNELLLQGIDVNTFNDSGDSLLSVACGGSSLRYARKIVELLIDHGADMNKYLPGGHTPLFKAVLANRPVVVKILLEKGANPNINLFPKHSPKIVSSALDLAYTRFLNAVVRQKKGYYDDFNVMLSEIYGCKCMLFLLTEAGARMSITEGVPEYS
jgi:ankyrin repeat protein